MNNTQSITHSCDICHYQLNFERFHGHYVDICLRFVAQTDNPIVWMPTWIAGSYLIREFAKNVGRVICTDDFGHHQLCQKISKNRWQLTAKQGQALTVRYAVYCRDVSVRSAYVDDERIFINFSSLLLLVDAAKQPCTIELIVPKLFFEQNNKQVQLASGLDFECRDDDKYYYYYAANTPDNKALTAFSALDYPVQIAAHQMTTFVVRLGEHAIRHRFFVSGTVKTDLTRLGCDLQAICQAYVDWLGFAPFNEYTFIAHATLNDYGGLEHINSTALITPRADLFNFDKVPNDEYQRFLGLCSHEYFHSWWVKSVCPDVMITSRLEQEAYTPLLWVFEGFTSYIDDWMLYRAGVINELQYLDLLAAQITRYQNTLGRYHQSVAESSFDTWIKLYRPDENSQNSTVSYYNKGALVALGLDLLLIERGSSLLDVIYHFAQLAKNHPDGRFGLSDDKLDEVLVELLGDEWVGFRHNYVEGVADLPLQTWLLKQGICISFQTKSGRYGLSCDSTSEGLKVKQITSNSSAMQAGLAVGDVIVAIDGLKATDKDLHHHARCRHDIQVHIFRGDVLSCRTLVAKKDIGVVQRTHLQRQGDDNGWLRHNQ